MIYTLTPDIYHRIALALHEAIGCKGYFVGSVVITDGDTDCRLTVTIIVSRREVQAPDGVSHPIADLLPVWWEFHSVTPGGEVMNDFSFSEMKTYIL